MGQVVCGLRSTGDVFEMDEDDVSEPRLGWDGQPHQIPKSVTPDGRVLVDIEFVDNR